MVSESKLRDPNCLEHHVNYEFQMLKFAFGTLQNIVDAGLTPERQGVFNAMHEVWCLHAMNLLKYMDHDFENIIERVETQLLRLDHTRTAPTHKDRILSPHRKGHEFILERMKNLGYP